MSQPGRRKGENLSEGLKGFLQSRGAKWTSFLDLVETFGDDYADDQIRNAIYNLTERHGLVREGRGNYAKFRFSPKAVKAEVGTAIHEQVDAYINGSPSLDDRALQVLNEVPQDEPQGTFKIKGSLVDGGHFLGTVVSITSPGWSDRPYLITEL